MGQIVADVSTLGNQGGRHAGSFKDGTFIRRVEVRPGNELVVFDTEGRDLYHEHACPQDFSIQSISCETSSFSGTLVLILGGFSPNTDDSRTITISTGYQIAPPRWYEE